MLKRFTVILVLLAVIFSAMPAYASVQGQFDDENPVIYERIINVTEKGGVFQVGYTTIKFPENFVDAEQWPIEITVKISAVDGVPGIEFSRDLVDFNKEVTIIVHSYNGLLYDETSKQNIQFHTKSERYKVTHFSRYAFS